MCKNYYNVVRSRALIQVPNIEHVYIYVEESPFSQSLNSLLVTRQINNFSPVVHQEAKMSREEW